MDIKYNIQSKRYEIIDAAYNDRHKIKNCGFKFCELFKVWYTVDLYRVHKLSEHFSFDTFVCDFAQKPTGLELQLDYPLYPYQKEGVVSLFHDNRKLLADEPGLGKTRQAIVLADLKADNNTTILIFTPASIKEVWAEEIDEVSKNPVVRNHQVIYGGKDNFNGASTIILNYDLLAKKHIVQQILKIKNDVIIICDEAHYLKNTQAKRTKAMYYFVDTLKVKYKLMITGTPVLNRPIELFPLFKMLDENGLGPYKNYRTFAIRYCRGHQGKWGFDVSGSSNEEELKDRIALRNLMIRRFKNDVLKELPEKTMQLLVFDQTGRIKNILEKTESFYALEDVMRNPKLYMTIDAIAKARQELATAKIDQSLEAIKDLADSVGKVVVFAWHTSIIEKLTEGLSEYNPVVITGRTKAENRQEAIVKFQNDPNTKIFIGNILAAGVGITLTAASHVEFVETTWVPGEVMQAIDRCHRIGQKNSVNARFHVIKDSLDQQVMSAIIKKTKVISKIL